MYSHVNQSYMFKNLYIFRLGESSVSSMVSSMAAYTSETTTSAQVCNAKSYVMPKLRDIFTLSRI